MTIRDLTKQQLYNLRRREQKQRREWEKERRQTLLADEFATWQKAYNLGLKAGLEVPRP